LAPARPGAARGQSSGLLRIRHTADADLPRRGFQNISDVECAFGSAEQRPDLIPRRPLSLRRPLEVLGFQRTHSAGVRSPAKHLPGRVFHPVNAKQRHRFHCLSNRMGSICNIRIPCEPGRVPVARQAGENDLHWRRKIQAARALASLSQSGRFDPAKRFILSRGLEKVWPNKRQHSPSEGKLQAGVEFRGG